MGVENLNIETKFEKLERIINASTIITHDKWVKVFTNIDSYNLQEKEKMLRAGASIIWYHHERFAIKAFFIDHNVELAKQHFFTCGRLDEFQIAKFDSDILDWGLNHIGYALLSDCKELIERYSNLKHSKYEKMVAKGNSTAIYILQCLIKDDWTEYERAMVIMKTKTLKKYPIMQWDHDFFEGMAERNKTKIETALAGLVTPKVHKRRNIHDILLNEFISHPALGYTKLAWLKGIEAEVNSPLVPRELLPVKPLNNYVNEYSFFDEIK